MKKKLYAIERYLVANKTVKVLEDCVKDIKEVCEEKKKMELGDEREDFIDCKSIKDIENAGDFEYKLEEEAQSARRKCQITLLTKKITFMVKKQSKVFIHLKETLKNHLKRKGHKEKLKKARVQSKLEEKYESRDKRGGRSSVKSPTTSSRRAGLMRTTQLWLTSCPGPVWTWGT